MSRPYINVDNIQAFTQSSGVGVATRYQAYFGVTYSYSRVRGFSDNLVLTNELGSQISIGSSSYASSSVYATCSVGPALAPPNTFGGLTSYIGSTVDGTFSFASRGIFSKVYALSFTSNGTTFIP